MTQFAQVHLSPTQKMQSTMNSGQTGFSADLQKSMQIQMKWVLPLLIGFFAYQIQAAVGLYWIVNNLITMGQERAIAAHLKKKHTLFQKAEVLK